MALLLLAGCVPVGGSLRRPPGGMVVHGHLGPSAAPRFPGGARSSFQYSDTLSAQCASGIAAACVTLYGKEAASVAAVANAVKGAMETPKPPALDELTRGSIEEKLVKCANDARSDVLLKHAAHFPKGGRPTDEECKQLTTDPKYAGKTWAQQLGIEMHEAARNCAEAALEKLVPGRFSLEQRYRYDPNTKQKKPVSADEEKALVKTGNAGELKGSLKPDVVIHIGDVLAIQAVYDFKFRCVNDGKPPDWDSYPEGHLYEDANQEQMYKEAFGVVPLRVAPRLGVIR
ncbi:hypothetical protein [Archangium sp.]|uniref:hypothetical protein n=1 Tax=Archangium sp. TaxID=1872627 RepID=UPI00286C3CC6|nr:hypothetical protein [Archangium sp.]